MVLLKVGIEDLDRLISNDNVVGFSFQESALMGLFYHRALVESAPVDLVLVGSAEIDPYLVNTFSRILGKSVVELVHVRRAFKREDVLPTLDSFKGDLIIVEPYIYHSHIYSGLMKRKGSRTFLFFTSETNTLRAETSILDLYRHGKEIMVKVRKSPSYPKTTVKFPIYQLYCKEEVGLAKWL